MRQFPKMSPALSVICFVVLQKRLKQRSICLKLLQGQFFLMQAVTLTALMLMEFAAHPAFAVLNVFLRTDGTIRIQPKQRRRIDTAPVCVQSSGFVFRCLRHSGHLLDLTKNCVKLNFGFL